MPLPRPELLLGIWCFLRRDPPRGQSDRAAVPVSSHPRRARFSEYLVILRTPSYLLDTAGMAAMTFATGGIAFWMPRYLSVDRNAGSLASVNINMGILTVVCGLAATFIGGVVGDKLRVAGRVPIF